MLFPGAKRGVSGQAARLRSPTIDQGGFAGGRSRANSDSEKKPFISPSPGFPGSSRDKIRALDGLRGIACLIVFNYHFLWPWTPTIMMGYGAFPPRAPEPYFDWSTLPIICLLHRGRPMVAIFFAISGYVLCRHVLRAIHERRLDVAYKKLASSVFRRVFRLYIPPTLSMLLVAILAQVGVFRSEDAIFKGPDSAYINGTVGVHRAPTIPPILPNMPYMPPMCPNYTTQANGTWDVAKYFQVQNPYYLGNTTDWPPFLCLNKTSKLMGPAGLYDIPKERPFIKPKPINTTLLLNSTKGVMYGPYELPKSLWEHSRGRGSLYNDKESMDTGKSSFGTTGKGSTKNNKMNMDKASSHSTKDRLSSSHQKLSSYREKRASTLKPRSFSPESRVFSPEPHSEPESSSTKARSLPGSTMPAGVAEKGQESRQLDFDGNPKSPLTKKSSTYQTKKKSASAESKQLDSQGNPKDAKKLPTAPKKLSNPLKAPLKLVDEHPATSKLPSLPRPPIPPPGVFPMLNGTNGTNFTFTFVPPVLPLAKSDFMWVQLGGSWEEHPIIYDHLSDAIGNFTRVYVEWANPFFYGHYHPRYDPHTFTIPMEFRGSMLIYLFLLGTAALRAKWRLIFGTFLAFYCLQLARWEMAAFMGGMMLSEMDIRQGPASSSGPVEELAILAPFSDGWKRRRPGLRRFMDKPETRYFLLVLALYFLSYPDAGAEYTPGFRFLSSFVPRYYGPLSGWQFYQSMGALLLLPCVLRSPTMTTFLEGRFAQYMGKISFSFYLVHGPVLHSLGFWIMPRLFDHFGMAGGFIVGWCILMGVALYLSNWWYKKIDTWSTSLGKRIEMLLGN